MLQQAQESLETIREREIKYIRRSKGERDQVHKKIQGREKGEVMCSS
jgi:hypothetical protein